MRCLLWVYGFIFPRRSLVLCCMQYRVILKHYLSRSPVDFTYIIHLFMSTSLVLEQPLSIIKDVILRRIAEWHDYVIKWKHFPRHWSFVRRSTGDRWIPLTKASDTENFHDDVIKWKHFPRYWSFVRGIHRSRWIPRTKASDAEPWCFLWSAPQ